MQHKLTYIFLALSFITLYSCFHTPTELDSLDPHKTDNKSNRITPTRSTIVNQDDSLTMISNIQGDLNNLLLSRIVKINNTYVLSLKREDAIFLGIPSELYDSYVDYVDKLNNNEANKL